LISPIRKRLTLHSQHNQNIAVLDDEIGRGHQDILADADLGFDHRVPIQRGVSGNRNGRFEADVDSLIGQLPSEQTSNLFSPAIHLIFPAFGKNSMFFTLQFY
jgi:hypothetical protein